MGSANEQWLFPELRAFILQSAQSSASQHGEGNTSVGFRTPSLTQSQIPWAQELQYRRSTCAFVTDLAAMVEIPESPAITAQLYVQRFYMLHSFTQHDRFLVATAALFLAAKTEEFPIKVRLMTECALYLLVCPVEAATTLASHSKAKGRTSSSPAMDARKRRMSPGNGNDPSQQPPQSTAASKDPEALKAKHLKCLNALLNTMDVGEVEQTASRVLLLERILLQTLSFEIGIPQPFAYVAPAMELVFALEAMHPSISHQNIRLCAYLFLADAIKNAVCLAFDPKTLAIGAVYLSCIHRHQVGANVATQSNEPWWTVWGLSSQELQGKKEPIASFFLAVARLTPLLGLADVARALLWMYENQETGKPLEGLSESFQELWALSDPQKNLPDLEYIKKLDAHITQDRK